MVGVLSAISAACFLCLCGYLCYVDRVAGAVVALVAAVMSVLTPSLSNITELNAGLAGIQIKIVEASNVIQNLRKLAVVMGQQVVDLQLNTGALGGNTASSRDKVKNDTIDLLRSLGADQADLDKVKSSDRLRNLADYGRGLQTLGTKSLPEDRKSEWYYSWASAQRKVYPTPSVEPFYELLRAFDLGSNQQARKIIDEYRFYAEHGYAQDEAFFKRRDDWIEE